MLRAFDIRNTAGNCGQPIYEYYRPRSNRGGDRGRVNRVNNGAQDVEQSPNGVDLDIEDYLAS